MANANSSSPTKAVILAGGLGTRLSEETSLKPKPMVEIGGRPILWHILKIYSHHGVNDFVICAGYKGYVIKEYFANYFLHMSDVTFDMQNNSMEVHSRNAEPWRVTIIDTGDETMTGGRLLRAKPYIGDATCCLTYGDGVADVNVAELLAFHRDSGKKATMTAVQPPGRYGSLRFDDKRTIERVTAFQEKPQGDGAWINGGFFVLEPSAFDYIGSGDKTIWEREPLEQLASDGELIAYRHRGFWQPMDTLCDRNHLEEMWDSDSAPWKTWS